MNTIYTYPFVQIVFLDCPAQNVPLCGSTWRSNTNTQQEVNVGRMTIVSCLTTDNFDDAVNEWDNDPEATEATYGPISAWHVAAVTDMGSSK